jgi:hypothetical protein
VRITPPPFRAGGPRVLLGGSTEPAARRAAHIADGFVPSLPQVSDYYRDELRRLGRPDPGVFIPSDSQVIALAHDPEKGWETMAPFFLYETNSYGQWRARANRPGSYHSMDNVDQLRAAGTYQVYSAARLIEHLRSMDAPRIAFHPLCGGMPIDLAWESLRIFEHEVLPAVR